MLKKAILESVEAKNSLLFIEKDINVAINIIYKKIKNGGKVLLCGNGGSAADAQHLVAEFLIRLRPHINRNPIAALSLSMDTSTLTACGNDYSFNEIFSRNLMALGSKKDVLIAISTSGRSSNIIKVLKTAKKMNPSKIFYFQEMHSNLIFLLKVEFFLLHLEFVMSLLLEQVQHSYHHSKETKYQYLHLD